VGRTLDEMPSILFHMRPTGELEYCNKRWIDYTGMSVRRSFAWGWSQAIHQDDLAGLMRRWGEVVQSGRGGVAEARIRRSDGHYRWFLFTARCFRDEAGRIVRWYGAATDIDDRKRAEDDVRKQRQEICAASIAHEVAQPLAAILTNGQVCLRWLDRDAPNLEQARRAATRMMGEGRRATDVIHRLRALALQRAPERARVNLNEVIHDAVPLVEAELDKHRIALKLLLAADLPQVLGDKVQLRQVLVNLMLNAAQATAKVHGRPRSLCIRTERCHRQGVQVRVVDSGLGIDPAHFGRLFDAFFTTRPDGMGIGLSLCRSIIESHGGQIWSSNNDGSGATFGFVLSQAEDAL
jgi:PAS domain S-box-containing protein